MNIENILEKRHHLRIPLTFVSVELFSKNFQLESSETCSIVDLSESGMKFVTNQHLDIGRPVLLTFILPGSTIAIKTTAAVIYQQLHHSLYSTGVKFTVVGLVEFTLLKTYIESIALKN